MGWTCTASDFERMGKTARAGGAVSGKALVPRWIAQQASHDMGNILDFGCGPKAPHTRYLRDRGYIVIGYEWPPGPDTPKGRRQAYQQSVREGVIDPDALDYTYDTVALSNVVNVQPTWGCFHQMINTTKGLLDYQESYFVTNLASEPRHIWSKGKKKGYAELKLVLAFHFMTVDEEPVPGSKESVFICTGPIQRSYQEEHDFISYMVEQGRLLGDGNISALKNPRRASIKLSPTLQSVFETDIIELQQQARHYGLSDGEKALYTMAVNYLSSDGTRYYYPDSQYDAEVLWDFFVELSNDYDDMVESGRSSTPAFDRRASQGLATLAGKLLKRKYS